MSHARRLDRAATDVHDDVSHRPLGVPGKSTVTSRYLLRARDGNGVAAGAEQAVERAAGSSGEALPGPLRERFEASLGVDLGAVRVHTDEASAEAAAAVGARAYALGNDIHFGPGHWDPGTAEGQYLIAHEVAHTVQQAGGGRRAQFKLEVSSPGDAAELEADTAAAAMVAGAPAMVSGGGALVQRDSYTCDPSTASCADADGNPVAPGSGAGVSGKAAPLKIAGVEVAVKVGPDGLEGSVGTKVPLPSASIPLGATGLSLVIEPEAGVTGKLKCSPDGQWSGALELAGSLTVAVRGGLPWAYVQGGVKLDLKLAPSLSNGEFSCPGELSGALVLQAALKLPLAGSKDPKDADKAPLDTSPKNWVATGGASFELVLAQAKLLRIMLTPGNFEVSYIGPDPSGNLGELEAWKQEYERNLSGGGASGAPPSYPTDPSATEEEEEEGADE
jgi:hypothetical protein